MLSSGTVQYRVRESIKSLHGIEHMSHIRTVAVAPMVAHDAAGRYTAAVAVAAAAVASLAAAAAVRGGPLPSTLSTAAASFSAQGAHAPRWQLVWSDEFDGTMLNASSWSVYNNQTHGPKELQLCEYTLATDARLHWLPPTSLGPI